jgi:alginate O-acetyltransferase complex protein AlgI
VELLIYTLFPLTLLAGPIDRVQRFMPDLRAGVTLNAEAVISGGGRVVGGLFKKFVVADTLALVALSPQIAADTRGAVGAWLVVYIYAFQIYLDFSGYTDIVIGLGRILGFDLPENFNAPYLKPNLRLFWQNWHMTLTDWFRGRVFLPMSRRLLRADFPLPAYLVAQSTTMLLIGFWHGVTVNFALWALWHTIGLAAQRWAGFITRRHVLRFRQHAGRARLLDAVGVLLTFHYVAVGWVFFALPEPGMAFDHLRRMFTL